MPEYDRLTIRLDPDEPGGYEVYAEGGSGEAHGRFQLPFHERDLENFVLHMSQGRRAVRRMETDETTRAQSFGGQLFRALVCDEVRDVYRTALADARRADRGLRITLQLTKAPELMDVPWEYLYDDPSFLSISAWTPVVRYMDLPRPRAPLAVRPPLRILGMVSSPPGYPSLNVDEERARLQTALDPLIADGRVELQWTERASLSALLRLLQRNTFHIFHYIGHGAYDRVADDGVLVLEGPHGGEPVTGWRLGTILCEHRSLRLAVLNACEGARTSRNDPFAGVAASLVQRELPAVIAMQFEITDEAAIVFSEFFYDAIALGQPVDSALAYARQGVYADGNDVEWATPVLLMRVSDGRLFDIAWERARAPEPRMSLQLGSDPSTPRVGEPVTWRLAVANVGEPALSAIRASGPDGRALASPIELPSGEEGVISWTDVAEAEAEHRIAVEAVTDHGERIREEVVARVAVVEREPERDPLAMTLECEPSAARAGEEVRWQLTLRNRGSAPLAEVTALGPDGRELVVPTDLAAGERRVLRWRAPAPADGRYLVTVGAAEPGGGAAVREVPGRVDVLAAPRNGGGGRASSGAGPERVAGASREEAHDGAAAAALIGQAPSVPSVSSLRPFVDHLLGGALAGVVGAAASFWLWSASITEKIQSSSEHKLLSDVRTVAYLVVFWGIFAAIYAGVVAAARRGPRSPIGAALIGFALGAAGALVGGFLRFNPTRDDVGFVLALAVVGLAVGAAGGLGTSRATRPWYLAAGLLGGLVAGVLLADGRALGGLGRQALYFGLGLIVTGAVGLAAQITTRRPRAGRRESR